MTQQERILKLGQEQIARIGHNGPQQWGKSFKAGFTASIDFTLANLWISVEEDLPELSENDYGRISVPVLIQGTNGAITKAKYFALSGEVPDEGWLYIDAGFGIIAKDKVTHWMPIPALLKGGAK